jgi:hypothetical protein
MLLLLSICYQVNKCSAQAADGLRNSVQFSPGPKGALNTGNRESVTDAVRDAKNSSVSESAKPSAHSVTLSWNPSVPATKSARDAIIGYIVYRSTKPHDSDAKPINVIRVSGTTFVDSDVEPGKTYYYVTRAVSASGALSGPSNEARAEIPR